MSDLISRKALLECFNPDDKETPWAIAARARITQQPTAYDPDKVVEQLKEASYMVIDFEYEEYDAIDVDEAIEIVKKGGVSDETCKG